MKRFDVIKILLDSLADETIALFTAGMISREAFCTKDRKRNFYMIGSMGLVSAVGLGIALNTRKKVVIFDGDGSLLMDMGTMANIASLRPNNLIHFVLDNKSYGSTGGQPTISSDIELKETALALGYSAAYRLRDQDITSGMIKEILEKRGPVFVLIKINKRSNDGIGRVSIEPERMKERIMEALT